MYFVEYEWKYDLNSSNASTEWFHLQEKPIFLSRWLVHVFLSQILYIVFNNLTRQNVLQNRDMMEISDKITFVRNFVLKVI